MRPPKHGRGCGSGESVSEPPSREAEAARSRRPAEAIERACRRLRPTDRLAAEARAGVTQRSGREHDATATTRPRARGRQGRERRRRGRARGASGAAEAASAPVQDPGGDQAPAGSAGAGRQGGARQQGRGAHHLPLARRPLFGADAEHGARRRHLAQDHHAGRSQAPEVDRLRARGAGGHGRDPAHRRRQPHQERRSSATSNICCGSGRTCAS